MVEHHALNMRTSVRFRNPLPLLILGLFLLFPSVGHTFPTDNDGKPTAASGQVQITSRGRQRISQSIQDQGGRPQGCPHRFCGCALSIKLFGRQIKDLNLAANWLHRFQRTSPAPGMVGARRGHVLKLLAHVSGSVWQVWDPNNGGRIRIHSRDIRSFAIVNPNMPKMALK